jgi:hypothetical protein
MVIEEKDFRLIPISESSPMFDLELLYIIRPKGKEERQEFKNAAYGISLEAALKEVAHYRIYYRHEDNTIDLKTYLTEFKEEVSKLKELCNI